MTKANYSLRLQPSLKSAAERIAMAEGTSVNQFINVAMAEKIAAIIEAEAYFTRSGRARAAVQRSWPFWTAREIASQIPPSVNKPHNVDR